MCSSILKQTNKNKSQQWQQETEVKQNLGLIPISTESFGETGMKRQVKNVFCR